MSQSVKQCMTANLFPHDLANVVGIQKKHLLLHTPVLNKTPRLSSARMFVRLYRLLLKHCIYVSGTNQHVLPLMSGWILVPSDPWRWQEKLLCSVVWHYHQSYVQHYMAYLMLVQFVLQSMQKFGLVSFMVETLSGIDSDHGIGPRRYGSVNSKSTLCPI